ncbi:PREDICTED: peptide methionine sulfoxide reductase isoform X2 [Nicrophorus vespilloides]|uniref:peptide-methionine (S)-S-oxide reductase n=1 Tax=Nicrophorus vespilloides TaxID=110193 RepID=A0ABM1MQ48_NICVS|nr:PREDICTED: peptide methionine sulfoxide reductase isoform X2 [Nicrophorus vespilloides]
MGSIQARTMPCVRHEINTPYEKATFGMGCFWASDSLYGATPGVLRTKVGYSGGTKVDPKYRDLGDHTEVIEIHYDPKIVSYEDLLELFWNNHEYGLTTIIKRQYMSLILYHNEDQLFSAEKSLKQQADRLNQKLMTEIASAGKFYPAEDYHQKYRLQRHPWLCEMLEMTSSLLQTSHIASRLNGYLVGLGNEQTIEKELEQFGFNEKMIDYVRKEWKTNEGGSLYC